MRNRAAYRGRGPIRWPGACLGVALLLSLACGADEPGAPDVVAEVGGEVVRYGEFEGYIKATAGDLAGVYGSDVLSGLFDEFLRQRCLVARAVDEGLVAADAGVREALRMLVDSHPLPLPQPEEVMAFYRAHRSEFERPERLRLRQILVEQRSQAVMALERLRAGERFIDVARQVSIDPSAGLGGDQGWLTEEDLPPAFVEPITNLAPGEISDVVVADYGFHLFLVEAIEPRTSDFAAVELEVTRALDAERRQRQVAELVEEAIGRYNVRIFERNLPFNYQGSLLTSDDS